jgi:arabinose-5-phosphate isomerase
MAKVNYISIAKKAAAIQISELRKINKIFDQSFVKAVELIANCKGKVIAAGVGKSGLIARKISSTLSSVGISSFFLNPSEANHGDLGQIDKRDLLLIIQAILLKL